MKIISQIILFSIIVILFSCSPEKKYQYEVNPVTVSKSGSEKNNHKSTTEFISIAYSDLFGTSIPQTKLINLSVAYNSFGDQKVIEDKIIKNLLNDSSLVLPVTPAVNGDTALFIINSYKKFYNREPDEFEKHYWIELLRNNNSVLPATMYYALMTSDEYRFY